MLSGFDFVLIGLAALAAGAVNALAGGGTLITFPMLVAVGIPAVAANVTNTVALCPGYFGGTFAQRNDLRGQEETPLAIMPASIIGGVLGGFLLLQTGEKLIQGIGSVFDLAGFGIAGNSRPRPRLADAAYGEHHEAATSKSGPGLPVGLASIYGGYFGAG